MTRRTLSCLFLLATLVACGHYGSDADDHLEAAAGHLEAASSQPQPPAELLFVQEARGFTFEGDTLTLSDVRPQVLFFTDRPERMAGYLTIDEFLAEGVQGPNSFADDPPNATLVSLEGDEFIDVVMNLSGQPRHEAGNLIFPIHLIQGEPPPAGGTCALFIDPLGRPVSPTSVAGSHRRHRRRVVRAVTH